MHPYTGVCGRAHWKHCEPVLHKPPNLERRTRRVVHQHSTGSLVARGSLTSQPTCMLSFQRAAITTDQRSFHDKKGKIQPAQCSRLATPIPKKTSPSNSISVVPTSTINDMERQDKTKQGRTRQNKTRQNSGGHQSQGQQQAGKSQIIDTSAYIVAYRNHMNRINRKGAVKACAH